MKILSYVALFIFILSFTACGLENAPQQIRKDLDEKNAQLGEKEDENEIEIDPQTLSDAIKNDIQNRYAGAQLLEADEITRPDGSLTYDVEIQHQGQITELMYDAQANFLGLEVEDEEEEEDENN